ncbi:MAG TPA: hypothetical protein VIL25_09380 [Vicinamibacterales bacterium]
MGLYVDAPGMGPFQKDDFLIEHYGATRVVEPESLAEIPAEKMLICVVRNHAFDAAGIIFDERELKRFTDPGDPRPRTWLLMDRETVLRLQPEVADYLTRAD